MGVEQPACLVALAAAAVPLLLHLRSRRAVRSVPFPNVELLRRVAREVRRERVLAGAWLLAARAGVVALAALALARPYLGQSAPGGGAPAEGDVVILLDRSSAWADPRAFEEARAAAGEIIDLVKPPGRALLVPFDDLPGPAVDERTARAALDAVRATGRAPRVGPALAAAAGLPSSDDSADAEGPSGERRPRTVVLLTTPDGAAEALAMKRRGNEHLLVYAPGVAPAGRENLAVVAASLEDAAVGVGGKVRVRVRIARTGGAHSPRGGRELRLFFDEDARPAASMEVPRFVRGPAGGSGAGELDLVIEAPRRRPGSSLLRVELHPADERAADDRRFLVLPASERIRVATLGSADRGSRLDIRAVGRAVEALAKAGRSSAAVLPIESRALPASRLTPQALEPFDVLVVGDVEAVPSGAWRSVTAFVCEGGALLALVPGRVPPGARRLFGLGRAEGGTRSSPEGGAALAGGGSGDDARRAGTLRLLGRARFPSYLMLNARAAAPLRFETGDPALVVSRIGRGRASLLAAGVGHLGGTPSVLVPLADALVRLAAARPPAPLAVEAGAA
ncbi:MAG: BatA domain-containing protein, partial [Planctomycetota bacterium]